MKLQFFILLLAAAHHMLGTSSHAATRRPQLKFEEIASVEQPVHITHAGDDSGRVFIVSKTGKVHIYRNGALLPDPFLDLSELVSTESERGLLSIAFPPGYASKRHFFAVYSRVDDGALVLSRFTVSLLKPNQVNLAFKRDLLVIPHESRYHYGGQAIFGPDGYLYLSVGDGDPGFLSKIEAQDTDSILGKILRIDTGSTGNSYTSPSTNPYVGVPGAREEIWASGLRNPWRFSFDRQTGDLYIADVGQKHWEEINFQSAGDEGGRNYGWPHLEADVPFYTSDPYDPATLTPPVIRYDRDAGNSVTGGHVYRGPANSLTGLYIYADYGSGRFWGAEREGDHWNNTLLEETSMQISSFGEDQLGRLYVADIWAGKVLEVIEDLEVRSPIFSPESGVFVNDLVVTANARTDGSIVHYTIDGTEPTLESLPYPSDGLLLDSDTTVRVAAFYPDRSPSSPIAAEYSFMAAMPTISPNNTTIQPGIGQVVAIETETTQAVIHYTLDGSVPDAGSPRYSGPIFLEIGPAEINAIAYRENYAPSPIAAGEWDAPIIIRPYITPPTNILRDNARIEIRSDDLTRYTTDGSEPDENSEIYRGPFKISKSIELWARCYRYGHMNSERQRDFRFISSAEGTQAAINTGSVELRSPEDLCVMPDGTLFVAVTGNHTIRRIAPDSVVSTFAGNGTPGYVDGSSGDSRFSSPRGICSDRQGNLYVADDGNHVIRKITPEGVVTTYAGSGIAGTQDGPGALAQFSGLQGLSFDTQGNLLVGCIGMIREINAEREVRTLAVLPNAGRVTPAVSPDGRIFATDSSSFVHEVGDGGSVTQWVGGEGKLSDGFRDDAKFGAAVGIAADSLGFLYVCDGNDLRKISKDGWVSTAVLGGIFSDLWSPRGLSVAPDGTVWIANTDKHSIWKFVASDWDLDGIHDDQEVGTTPFVVGIDDRLADLDQDGQSNTTEFKAGSDPRDPASKFEIFSLTPGADGENLLKWKVKPGAYYYIDFSYDLDLWQTIPQLYGGNGPTIEVRHRPDQARNLFYRVDLD